MQLVIEVKILYDIGTKIFEDIGVFEEIILTKISSNKLKIEQVFITKIEEVLWTTRKILACYLTLMKNFLEILIMAKKKIGDNG